SHSLLLGLRLTALLFCPALPFGRPNRGLNPTPRLAHLISMLRSSLAGLAAASIITEASPPYRKVSHGQPERVGIHERQLGARGGAERQARGGGFLGAVVRAVPAARADHRPHRHTARRQGESR